MNTTTPEQLAAVLQRWQPACRLLRSWPLTGGISSRMTAFEFEGDSGLQTGVLRCPGDWSLQQNPAAAAVEFSLLSLLHAEGFPVPQPLWLETDRPAFPGGGLVLAFVDGSAHLNPADEVAFVGDMAALLARLHAIPGVRDDLDQLPRIDVQIRSLLETPPAIPDESLGESRIRRALGAIPVCAPSIPCLLHGDFWPGNLLWRGQRCVAVIDWEDACLGHPLFDVAITRLDLRWSLGAGAMDDFTRAYQAASGQDLEDLPHWDLIAALRPMGQLERWSEPWIHLGRPEITAQSMREAHREFVDAALHRLA